MLQVPPAPAHRVESFTHAALGFGLSRHLLPSLQPNRGYCIDSFGHVLPAATAKNLTANYTDTARQVDYKIGWTNSFKFIDPDTLAIPIPLTIPTSTPPPLTLNGNPYTVFDFSGGVCSMTVGEITPNQNGQIPRLHYDITRTGGLKIVADAAYEVIIGTPHCWPTTVTQLAAGPNVVNIPTCDADCKYGDFCVPFPLQILLLRRKVGTIGYTPDTGETTALPDWEVINKIDCPAASRRRRGVGDDEPLYEANPQISINRAVCSATGGTPYIVNGYVQLCIVSLVTYSTLFFFPLCIDARSNG